MRLKYSPKRRTVYQLGFGISVLAVLPLLQSHERRKSFAFVQGYAGVSSNKFTPVIKKFAARSAWKSLLA